jgi:hypothetical protein
MKSTAYMIVLLASLLSLSCSVHKPGQPASAPAAEAAGTLGPKHIDIPDGFAIRPPAAAVRMQERPALRQVIWNGRDATSGAIAWTLSVVRTKDEQAGDDLAVLAKTLSQRLAGSDSKVESGTVIRLAGRQTVDLRRTLEQGRLWQRQLFVPAGKGEFVVVTISGPPLDKTRLSALCQASAETLELLDSRLMLQAREANLAAGRALLAGLTIDKLRAAVGKDDQWFRMDLKGQPVACLLVRESIWTVDGKDGLVIRHLMIWKQTDQGQVETSCSATADRLRERWSSRRSENDVTTFDKRGSDIVCSVPKFKGTRNLTLSESMEGVYLPRAIHMILGRLVDRGKATGYAFAVYNEIANAMDVRVMTVVGHEKITLGGKEVNAVRATDQAAEDVEAETLWLDESGRLLRTVTPTGWTVERSSRDKVLRLFPDAADAIDHLK